MQADSRRVNWTSVVTYYVLAAAISWPFYWWRDMRPASWAAWDAPEFAKHATYMWGPGIAALIMLVLFHRRHVRTVTFFGTSVVRSTAFYLVPMVALALAYAPELLRGDTLWLLIRLVVIGFLLILGEELGWRGFLQDALRPLPPVRRYALIGILWELWHFTNRTHVGPLVAILIRVSLFIGILFVLSWIFGEAVERTHSLVVAVTLHAWFNTIFAASRFFSASPLRAVVVLALAVVFWAYLLRKWPPGQIVRADPRSVPVPSNAA